MDEDEKKVIALVRSWHEAGSLHAGLHACPHGGFRDLGRVWLNLQHDERQVFVIRNVQCVAVSGVILRLGGNGINEQENSKAENY